METDAFDLRLALAACTGLALLCAAFLRRGWRDDRWARRMTANALLALFSLTFSLLASEWAFRTFLTVSDGWNITWASRRWHARYWKPVNSLGFRDSEHSDSSRAGRKLLFVLGDSFAAGHGIRDVRQRFADIIGEGLGPAWKVVLLARNGWNTSDQLAALRTQAQTPAAVLLSYYINDIDPEPPTERRAAQFVDMPDGVVRRIIEASHVFNFLYWRARRGSIGNDYWTWLKDQYNSPAAWNRHLRELEAVMDHAAAHDVALSVMVWPHLARVAESRAIAGRIAAVFQERGIPVLDLAGRFGGRPPSELVVNALDVHPDAGVHAEVARLWLDRIAPGIELRQ